MRISDWSSDVCSSDLGFRHDRTKDPDQCGRGIDIEEPSPEFQQDFVQFLPGKIVVGKSCNGGVRALRHESGEQALLAAEFAVDVPLRAASPFDDRVDAGRSITQLGRASCRERVCQYV